MLKSYRRRVPDRCKTARENRAWTQQEAAEKLGWHINTVRKFERVKVRNMDSYIHMVTIYDTSLDWIFLGKEQHATMTGNKLPQEVRQKMEDLVEALQSILGWKE